MRSFARLDPTRGAQPRGSTRLYPTRFADAPTRRDPPFFYAGPKA